MRAHPKFIKLIEEWSLEAVEEWKKDDYPVTEEEPPHPRSKECIRCYDRGAQDEREHPSRGNRALADLAAANARIAELDNTLKLMHGMRYADTARVLAEKDARIAELEARKTDSCDHCAASCASCGRDLHVDLRNAALEEAAVKAERFEYAPFCRTRFNDEFARAIRGLKKGEK